MLLILIPTLFRLKNGYKVFLNLNWIQDDSYIPSVLVAVKKLKLTMFYRQSVAQTGFPDRTQD